jgi:hypothetical protein
MSLIIMNAKLTSFERFLTVAAKAIETATPVKFPAEIDYDHEM